VPVIIISARDAKQDAQRGRKVVGNDHFLRKPFSVTELTHLVKQAIEQ